MKLKVALVGPSGAGKTLLANILSNEGIVDNTGLKPTYRPTHSVRIVEFTINNLDLRKYTMDVDVQLWEVGGNPALKSIYPGVQAYIDGIILMYDGSNEAHIREASGLHMHFVTHAPVNLSSAQCLIIGNNFRGRNEQGPQKIIGVPPRVRHIALNADDDPNRLREEVKAFVATLAQITLDQEKANLITNKKAGNKFISRKLTPVDFRKIKDEVQQEVDGNKRRSSHSKVNVSVHDNDTVEPTSTATTSTEDNQSPTAFDKLFRDKRDRGRSRKSHGVIGGLNNV